MYYTNSLKDNFESLSTTKWNNISHTKNRSTV